jgi:hypothetical protein
MRPTRACIFETIVFFALLCRYIARGAIERHSPRGPVSVERVLRERSWRRLEINALVRARAVHDLDLFIDVTACSERPGVCC